MSDDFRSLRKRKIIYITNFNAQWCHKEAQTTYYKSGWSQVLNRCSELPHEIKWKDKYSRYRYCHRKRRRISWHPPRLSDRQRSRNVRDAIELGKAFRGLCNDPPRDIEEGSFDAPVQQRQPSCSRFGMAQKGSKEINKKKRVICVSGNWVQHETFRGQIFI